jgi:predicted nucleic acid-binding protein
MYLVDTNIFLEVLLARSRRESCKKFLRKLRDGEKRGIVTDFTIHSIIVIMDSFKRLEALKTFLQSLTAYKGLHVFFTSLSTEIEAIEYALSKAGCRKILGLDLP